MSSCGVKTVTKSEGGLPPSKEKEVNPLTIQDWLIGHWVEENGCKENPTSYRRKTRFEARFYTYGGNKADSKHLAMGDVSFRYDCVSNDRTGTEPYYYYKVESERLMYSSSDSGFNYLSVKKLGDDEMMLEGRKMIRIDHDFIP